MKERRVRMAMRLWLLGLVSLFLVACARTKDEPTPPTTFKVVTIAAPETVAVTVSPEATPTATAPLSTATSAVFDTDLCRDYLELSVLYGETETRAAPTSYQCHNAHIDSTGQAPGPPGLVVHRGVPFDLELATAERPIELEVRLYPGDGVAASFLRWPEELPTGATAVETSLPEPGTRFQYLPQADPGPYTLNLKATWEEVEVFYAISLLLEEPATPTPTPEPTFTFTPAPTRTPRPTATPSPAPLTLDPGQAPDEVQLEAVEQIGGHSLAVAVEQGQVYVGIGPRVVALDGLSVTSQPQRVGQSEILAGIVEEIHVVDDLAYVAGGEAGLIVLDVADPSSIQLVSEMPIQANALNVFVEPTRGLAYVVGSEGARPEQTGRLSIVDVALPAQPEPVTTVEIPGPAYDVAVVDSAAAGRHAYITYEGGLLVMDVSDPLAPIEVANLAGSNYTRDLAVVGDLAYVTGEGLTIYDLSDRAAPSLVSHFELRFSANAVAVQGEFAYLSDAFCEMGHCGSTIHVLDLADLANPQEVGVWLSKSAVEDLFVQEDTLYLASRQLGLQVVDVRDPASPALLAEYATLASVEDIAVSGGLGYVSDGALSGLQVVDLSEMSGPRVRGRAASAQYAEGYAAVDGYAYVPGWVSGFRILDVRDPDAPRETVALELGQAEQAAKMGERVYLTMGYEGLAVLDVADPSAPQILGELLLEGLSDGLAVAGERAYVTVDAGEQHALHVIDVADPSQPGESGRVALRDQGFNVALDPTASHAYVAVANCVYFECSGGLQVVDVRDAGLPQTVAWVEVPGGVFDVAVSGEHVFVAAGRGGVWVLDVSDPGQPRAVGWRDTAGRARSLVIDGGRVYVADGQGGLLVYQVD